jgi:hypothetical protein
LEAKTDLRRAGVNMEILGKEEILAQVHKFKLFRSEGNLYIDLYEAIVGKSSHRFVAVPNILVREADEKYFGVGDSKKTALVDCLKKIKDVPIEVIIPVEDREAEAQAFSEIEEMSKKSHPFWKLTKLFHKGSNEVP